MDEKNSNYRPKSLSFRRIVFFVIIPILLFGSAYLYFDYSKKSKDPCRYESYTTMMKRFPKLKELWHRQQYQLKIQEARHELLSVQTDLDLERGIISAEAALALEQKRSDELLRLSDHQIYQYDTLCRQLVSSSKK